MNNPWIIHEKSWIIFKQSQGHKKKGSVEEFFFAFSTAGTECTAQKNDLWSYFLPDPTIFTSSIIWIIINNQWIIRLLTMWKWSDQEENRTSGHFFCRMIRTCGRKCKRKISDAPLFLWPWDFFKLIQDYSWIIVVVQKEGTFLWPRKGPFRFSCQ